jgi:hypothetical protein
LQRESWPEGPCSDRNYLFSPARIEDLFDLSITGNVLLYRERYDSDGDGDIDRNDSWMYVYQDFDVNAGHPYDAYSGGRFQKNTVPDEEHRGARHNTVHFPLNRTAPAGLYVILACRNWNPAPSPTAAFQFFLYDGSRRAMSRTESLKRNACADVRPYEYKP